MTASSPSVMSMMIWPKKPVTLQLTLGVGDAIHYCNLAAAALCTSGASGDSPATRSALAPGHLDGLTLRAPPCTYDVVSTSNLADSLGTVNLMVAIAPLLRPVPHATVMTQYLCSPDSTPSAFLQKQLGMDLVSASMLLGLAPVDW